MSCGVGRRSGSDPMLQWLWRRPAAAATIRPLAWELPSGCAPRKKTKKTKTKNKNIEKKKDSGLHPKDNRSASMVLSKR